MCGIAALIEPGRIFDMPLLEAMGEDLRHRGPDSGGIISEPGIGLVFRRLAILDPAARADQPMSDPDNRVTLIFNGEIYNYLDLRRELEQSGISFRTSGDTEVILQGYLVWGETILDRLEGMYAFVLYDRKANEVFAARDPLGIKPLYMLRKGKVTGFASEMRPFARITPPEPDPQAFSELLTFAWASGTLSNLKHIERVPGGTCLRISLSGGQLKRRRFCNPLNLISDTVPMSEEQAIEQASAAVQESITKHLASDVGYTCQLSGGVDSSLITAIAAGQTKEHLTTYGILLEDAKHDESCWRSQVAERYDIDHREIKLSARDFAEALPRAVRHMEGPSPHMGCVLLMLLCDEIRKTSKVVLTGEGADEFFGGYHRYGQWRKLRNQERLGHFLPSSLLPACWPFMGLKKFAERDVAAYASVLIDPLALQRTFPDFVPLPGQREKTSSRFTDFRDRLLAVDRFAYLESLLVRQDKMAMAASVEARVPFVHMPLARVLDRIPVDIRIPGGVTKPVLKKIAGPYLPHDLLYRRKVGLTLPLNGWLEDPEGLGRYLDDVSGNGSRLANFTEHKKLKRAVDDFRAGKMDDLPDMVRLVNIETWLRTLTKPSGPTLADAA